MKHVHGECLRLPFLGSPTGRDHESFVHCLFRKVFGFDLEQLGGNVRPFGIRWKSEHLEYTKLVVWPLML